VATSETGLIGDTHLVWGILLREIPGVIVPFMTEDQLLKKGVTIFSPPCSLPPFLFVCVRACVCSFPNLLDCLLILNLPLPILYILSPLYNFMDFFNYLQNLPFHVHPAGRGMWCVSNDLIINIYWMHMCVYCWLYIGFYISCQLIFAIWLVSLTTFYYS
jgi:hypothetical protein